MLGRKHEGEEEARSEQRRQLLLDEMPAANVVFVSLEFLLKWKPAFSSRERLPPPCLPSPWKEESGLLLPPS